MSSLLMILVAVVIVLLVLAYRMYQWEIQHSEKDPNYPGPR